jgi:hypothetical protein
LVYTDQSDGNPTYEYAALSYCWGEEADANRNLKLTAQSSELFENGIPMESMPAAIRDAIEVCKSLSIRYLWVDSLCIIQNDENDWDEQSPNMCNIYGCSLLTICALASSSCHEGFLGARSFVTMPFKSQIYPGINGQLQLMHISTEFEQPRFGGDSQIGMDIYISKWTERAWCHQEQLMAPRQLLLGRHRVHFHCSHKSYSENLLNADEGYFGTFWKQLEEFNDVISTSTSLAKLYSWWHGSVGSLYNSKLLTYPEDKLPALSGLATEFAALTKDQYIAGLWRNHLQRGLIWNRIPSLRWIEHLESLRAPDPTNLPTWSWLKFNCYYASGTDHFPNIWERRWASSCEIKDIYVELATANTFGRIKMAMIRVLGQTVPFTMSLGKIDTVWDSRPTDVGMGKDFYYSANFDWVNKSESTAELPDGLIMLKVGTCEIEAGNDYWDKAVSEEDNSEKDYSEENYSGEDDSEEDDSKEDHLEKDDCGKEHLEEESSEKDNLKKGDSVYGSEEDNQTESNLEEDAGEEALQEKSPRKQIVYGLFLYPTGNDHEYYRVGAFSTRRKAARGYDPFENVLPQEITIV